MKVSLSSVKGLNQEMTVVVPHQDVQPKIDKKLMEVASNARMPGFRPGKVPLKVFRERYGTAVRQEILADVVQQTYTDAIQQEALTPASMPEIEIICDKEGKDFEYKAKFEVMPKVTIKGLKKIKVNKIAASVTDQDVTETIDIMRKQYADWQVVSRASKNGDKVKVDFEGSLSGKVFDGGKADDFELELGSGNMIPGFESGIVGMKAGGEKTIKVKFPKDYQAEKLAGKSAKFAITLKQVLEAKLPELDTNFAKKFNIDSLDKFKQDIRINMARELELAIKKQLKETVLSGLLSENKLELPKAMVRSEAQALRQQFLGQMGIKNEKSKQAQNLAPDMFIEQAERRVTLGLLVAEIIAEHKIKADKDRVEAMMQQMAAVYEDEASMLQEFKANARQRTEIEQAVIEDKVVEYILAQAKVTETKQGFTEVMKTQNKAGK